MSFADRLIWITGASSGIGEALALALSDLGARLILSSRHLANLEAVRVRCRNPAKHLVVPLDLSVVSTIKEAAERVREQAGPVDILVNNGGISQRARAMETSLEVDRRLIEVNYLGTVALTKAVLPAMLARKSGHIVVISSVMGKFGTPDRSAYAASKHALHGFFDSLRAEHAGDGIIVTLVCPGYIRTAISINALAGDGSPFGRMDKATAAGLAPAVCASAIIKAIRRRNQEIYVGRREVLGVYLKRFVPGLFSRIITRVKVR